MNYQAHHKPSTGSRLLVIAAAFATLWLATRACAEQVNLDTQHAADVWYWNHMSQHADAYYYLMACPDSIESIRIEVWTYKEGWKFFVETGTGHLLVSGFSEAPAVVLNQIGFGEDDQFRKLYAPIIYKWRWEHIANYICEDCLNDCY